MWSLACVALEILSGKAPFYGRKSSLQEHLVFLYGNKETPLNHLAPKGSSQLFQEFDGFVPKDASDENRKAYRDVCQTMYELLSDCFSFERNEGVCDEISKVVETNSKVTFLACSQSDHVESDSGRVKSHARFGYGGSTR